jgi:hypothetical protein
MSEANSHTPAHRYTVTVKALGAIGASPADLDTLVRAVAAVLHIGNLAFVGEDAARCCDRADDDDTSAASGADHVGGGGAPAGGGALSAAARCLKVEAAELERALITTSRSIAGESVVTPNSTAQAGARRDATARLLFVRLFDHVVALISRALGTHGLEESAGAGAAAPAVEQPAPAKEPAKPAEEGTPPDPSHLSILRSRSFSVRAALRCADSVTVHSNRKDEGVGRRV